MDNYLNAYSALAKKKQDDDAAAMAVAPTEDERLKVRDQSALAALVGNLMKAQASMGSIGGKPTVNPDVNYGQYADINAKDLLERKAKSDDLLRISNKNFQGGRELQSDMMGAQNFATQQQAAPIDLAQRKANLQLTKQQILQGGKNPSDVDKDLANLQRIGKIRETATLIRSQDPQKSDELMKTADMLESKYGSVKPKPTAAEGAIDRGYAKEYNDWTTIDQPTTDKNLQRLEAAKAKLTGANTISGGIIGRLPDALRSTDSRVVQQDVQAAAQGALKATLGAQFTEKEGERIMKMAYDPTLPEAENIKKIDAAIKEIQQVKAAKQAKAGFYEKNGTLRGFKSTPSSAASPQPSKPKTVVQNGHTYTLNESTGEYE